MIHVPIESSELKTSHQDERSKFPVKMRHILQFLLVVCGLVALAVFFCGNNEHIYYKSSIFPSDEMTALVISREFVNDKMAAPATTVFYMGESASRQLQPDKYLITSYCDSQNKYGALIRYDYTCVMVYLGNGRWTCLNLRIESRDN